MCPIPPCQTGGHRQKTALPACSGEGRPFRSGLRPAVDQQCDGQNGLVQTGVSDACHLPSTPQDITLQVLPLQCVAHAAIGTHAAFFLASDGADDAANATTATVPTSRTFAIDF